MSCKLPTASWKTSIQVWTQSSFIPYPAPSWNIQLHNCNWWSLANQCLCVYAITLTLGLVMGPSLDWTLSARLHVQCSRGIFLNGCHHFSQHHTAEAVTSLPIFLPKCNSHYQLTLLSMWQTNWQSGLVFECALTLTWYIEQAPSTLWGTSTQFPLHNPPTVLPSFR